MRVSMLSYRHTNRRCKHRDAQEQNKKALGYKKVATAVKIPPETIDAAF
jgi:hypothetical protein